MFALLGPNGAGKTTTVEILEGFRKRDGGTVSVLGEDPQTAGLGWRNRLGIVLQSSTGPGPDHAARGARQHRQGLPHPARRRRGPRGGRAGRQGATTASASSAAASAAGSTSGSASSGTPELLFLDEPTTGFDPQARRDFWELIGSLADGGTTILLTTHYLDEAEQLADRVGVIAAGRMLAARHPGQPRRPGLVGGHGGVGGRGGHAPYREDKHANAVRRRARAPRSAARCPSSTVTRPSLEDTYLSLIAPHLRRESRPTVAREPELEVVAVNTARHRLGPHGPRAEDVLPREGGGVLLLRLPDPDAQHVLGDLRRQLRQRASSPASTPRGSSCPGMVAAGVMLTSFQSMALSVAVERDDGTLKRLRSTPMPPVAYFLGKVGLVAITSLAQFALLIAVAKLGFGVQLPSDAGAGRPSSGCSCWASPAGTVLGHRLLLAGLLVAVGRRHRHRPDADPAVHLRRLLRLHRPAGRGSSRWRRSSR